MTSENLKLHKPFSGEIPMLRIVLFAVSFLLAATAMAQDMIERAENFKTYIPGMESINGREIDYPSERDFIEAERIFGLSFKDYWGKINNSAVFVGEVEFRLMNLFQCRGKKLDQFINPIPEKMAEMRLNYLTKECAYEEGVEEYEKLGLQHFLWLNNHKGMLESLDKMTVVIFSGFSLFLEESENGVTSSPMIFFDGQEWTVGWHDNSTFAINNFIAVGKKIIDE